MLTRTVKPASVSRLRIIHQTQRGSELLDSVSVSRRGKRALPVAGRVLDCTNHLANGRRLVVRDDQRSTNGFNGFRGFGDGNVVVRVAAVGSEPCLGEMFRGDVLHGHGCLVCGVHGVVDSLDKSLVFEVDAVFVGDVEQDVLKLCQFQVVGSVHHEVKDVEHQLGVGLSHGFGQVLPCEVFGQAKRPAHDQQEFALTAYAGEQEERIEPVPNRRPQIVGHSGGCTERFSFAHAHGQWHESLPIFHVHQLIDAENKMLPTVAAAGSSDKKAR